MIDQTRIKFCFQDVSDQTLRISMLPENQSVSHVFSSMDLADRFRGQEQEGQSITAPGVFKTEHFQINLDEQLTLTVSRGGKNIQRLCVDAQTGSVGFSLGNGPIWGLGQGFKTQYDRRGEYYDLRTHGQVRGIIENHSTTSPVPYLVSPDGWAMFFHQPWRAAIDLRGEHGRFSQQPEQYLDLFLVAFDAPPDAVTEYYKLTGLPPMLPKYAFGYQQSYRTLVFHEENEVLKTARYMRENDIPCDLLVYLSTGYCDNGWNTYNGEFQWHPVSFPEPEKAMEQLHDMGYKVSLHVTKCHTGLHGSVGDTNVSPLEYDHVANYWKKHEKLYSQAKNEAWWPDDGDEVDSEQLLCRWKMYYEGSLALNPKVRPFQMQRNAFPGMTKYGGVIWSGDVMSEWETLKNQVHIGLNTSLSCSPYWGTDVGGFFCTEEFDGELFLRWFAYSVFTPFFRGHGKMSYLHNPWGWNRASVDDMPLEAGGYNERDKKPLLSAVPDERVEPACRRLIKLRYKLLPYIYSLSREVHECGMPMMRPLWLSWPDDSVACETGDEYLFGPSLLVAPVTQKGAAGRSVYLPQGKWYDYWSGEQYEGGAGIWCECPLDRVPLFVRAGGIIPTGPDIAFVDTQPKDDFEPLTLQIYTGLSGSCRLYEDDGISMEYESGRYTQTRISWDEQRQKLEISGRTGQFLRRTRDIDVCFMPSGKVKTLTVTYEIKE